VLPKSHIISEGLSRIGERGFASGGFADIWEGKLKDVEGGRSNIEKVGNSVSVPLDSFT